VNLLFRSIGIHLEHTSLAAKIKQAYFSSLTLMFLGNKEIKPSILIITI
jgi:hypothetical protein